MEWSLMESQVDESEQYLASFSRQPLTCRIRLEGMQLPLLNGHEDPYPWQLRVSKAQISKSL